MANTMTFAELQMNGSITRWLDGLDVRQREGFVAALLCADASLCQREMGDRDGRCWVTREGHCDGDWLEPHWCLGSMLEHHGFESSRG